MGKLVKNCPKCGIEHKKRGPYCSIQCANCREKEIKTCPQCGTEHMKRGPYCSRSCGNVRKPSDEWKEQKRKLMLEYHQTPEGIETNKKRIAGRLKYLKKIQGEYVAEPEDYAIEIPNFDDVEPKINW